MRKYIIAAIAATVLFFGSACSVANTTPVSINSAASATGAATATVAPAPSPESTAATPQAPASTVPTENSSVSKYLTLLGHNVPGKLPVVLTAPGANLTMKFGVGSPCTIQYGGTLTPGTVSGEEINLTYVFPYPPREADCPNGAQFRLPVAQYQGMAGLTKVVDEKIKAELLAMASIAMPSEHTAVEFPINPFVRVMNVDVVRNTNFDFGFWSMCYVGDDNAKDPTGKIEKLRDTPWGTLVEYTNANPRAGKECPSGTVFILDDQQLTLPFLLGYEKTLRLS